MTRIIEILMYTLKPGSGLDFHQIMQNVSVPLHLEAGIDVVSYGCSLHDSDSYHLIRSYESESHRQVSQEAFYASAAWKQGPREDIINRIEISTTTVLALAQDAIDAIRACVDLSRAEVRSA
ncbi:MULTISPECIES: NIPSNAP family protein [Pseudomonas]|uniref:NIPSNAP family protein n=1 Tax=Pseudomonas ogarae (strain DSM 112162 / CECT 30235 / F113) TaxID=1114970 RepID=A0ABN5G080_PSEO1|nr:MULTISPECIES: NIPSNAP family protein [Pseudomonas]AEV60051.1 NIPSNAP family containing protein [Pseudomonas ogarae]AUO43946.1 NIPSNAP family protein [Pseudomonas ogarae]UVM61488.1 NIPSNAP family protein [Pseudomonas sp. B21-010]WPN63609.1 NIPSNAP family protein [Pseudomonas sp. P9_32]WPN69361.1 NIPSNAP family protein [Pseudomonas sp. P9_35]